MRLLKVKVWPVSRLTAHSVAMLGFIQPCAGCQVNRLLMIYQPLLYSKSKCATKFATSATRMILIVFGRGQCTT